MEPPIRRMLVYTPDVNVRTSNEVNVASATAALSKVLSLQYEAQSNSAAG